MSLRFKIVIAIACLVLFLGLGGTLHARLTLSRISDSELERRAVGIARGLARDSNEFLLTNDMFGLYNRVHSTGRNSDDVRYVVIFDEEGDVRASTFGSALPAGLRHANALAPGDDYSVATVSTSDGNVVDVAYPIGNGGAGVIRVGLSEERLQGNVNDLTFRLLSLTGIVLLAGLVVGYLLATFLTAPLARLVEASRALGRGELSRRVPVGSHDETGQLTEAFNAMAEELMEKEEERSQLLAKVMAAQEDERKRIARELHDDAGQALTSMILALKDIEDSSMDESVRGKTSDIRALTTQTLDLVRDMALELRPSTLDDLGLVAALERYVLDYGRKHKLEVDFHAGITSKTRLQPQVETALYRIAQEALTNVIRHSQAGSVAVVLDRRDGLATLVVEDDGRGFDVEAVRHSRTPSRKLGILGMEERALLVGGRLIIESRPGAGTAVFAEVPTEQESQ